MLTALVASVAGTLLAWVFLRIGKQLGARGRILVSEPRRWPPGGWAVGMGGVNDGGEDVFVTGLGDTPQEAAVAAFKHAADLMFPPSSE